MIHILSKEFSSFLNSLIAYVVIGVFLIGMGLLVWVFPDTSLLDYGYADMGTLFSLAPYVFIFLIPAITMRSFAEEKKAGTMELLLTKPLTNWDILLGKFFACFLLVLFSLLPTLIYYVSIHQLGNPPGNIDTPGIIGSYVGLILLGGVFCSIGIFASSITPNQIVSFIVAAFLCFIVYTGFDSIAMLDSVKDYALTVRQWGITYHYESISRGLLDSRDLIYFLSVTWLILFLTRIILAARTW
jgi:ABC-2 type transport system permease protein